MTLTEALTRAHEELLDCIEVMGEIDKYCSGWKRRADTIGYYKRWELDTGEVMRVEFCMVNTRISYYIEGR